MSNVILSAFADEYAAELSGQIEVLSKYGFKYLEVRHVDGQNISTMSDDEVEALRAKLDAAGITAKTEVNMIASAKTNDSFLIFMFFS